MLKNQTLNKPTTDCLTRWGLTFDMRLLQSIFVSFGAYKFS